MFLLFGNFRPLRWLQALFLLIIITPTLTAQQKQSAIPQLLKQLETAREDTTKANLLDQIALSYLTDSMNMPQSIQYFNRELVLSKNIGWAKGQVKAYIGLYVSPLIEGRYQAAIDYLNQGYQLAKKNKLLSLQYNIEVYLGYAHMYAKQYEQAVKYFKDAAGYYLQTKELDTTSWFIRRNWWNAAFNVGYIYSGQKDDSAAVDYYQQLLNTSVRDNDSIGIRTALNLYIRYYNDWKQNYDKSLEYCFKELAYFKPGDTTSAHASVITYIANAYRLKKDYVRALEYYRHAIALKPVVHPQIKHSANTGMREIYRFLEDYNRILAIDLELYRDAVKRGETGMLGYHSDLASDYEDLKQFDSAMFYLNKNIVLMKKWKIDEVSARTLNSLAHIYYASHRYDDALRTINESIAVAKNESIAVAKDDIVLYTALLYQGMIIRDAPHAVLLKHGIIPSKRFPEAIKNLQRATDYFTHINSTNILPDCYRELSIAYDSIKDYKRFHDTYKKYIALRDSSVNRANQHAFISKLADIQFEKKEDSLKYQQRLTSNKLNQQTLATAQQRKYYLSGIIALLTLSFFIARNYYNQRKANRLVIAEKKRSDDLLLNILPADVAEELKEKGSAGARLFDDVTVLFTDFVNFTAISELLSPQQLVDELHYCFKTFDDIIAKYGIEKIKTIGDAYLAVAGLPHANPDHAANTIKAALEIRQFVQKRKALKGSLSFDIRIGIHSGSVVAGIVGVKKFAYDIWGDTVNTAARMEQNSSPGQINLSEKTYELVKEAFSFTYRGEIEAKNKGALKMYFVEEHVPVYAGN